MAYWYGKVCTPGQNSASIPLYKYPAVWTGFVSFFTVEKLGSRKSKNICNADFTNQKYSRKFEIENLLTKLDLLKIFYEVKMLKIMSRKKVDSGRKSDEFESNINFKA